MSSTCLISTVSQSVANFEDGLYQRMCAEQTITNNLHALGVQEGDALLVHSSLRSLGPVIGGAETVIVALLNVLGEHGTLLMPALSYESVGAHNPVFDLLNTPSCVGALPEYFRTRPETIRSIHPTHSVCASGHRAEELCADHELDTTPCGPHSPFSRLRENGGKVLFLGCGLRPNTSMHAIEEHFEPPYLFGESVDYRIILPARKEGTMCVRSHNFAGWQQRYDRLEQLLDHNGLTQGHVLQATAFLIDCRQMWKKALKALQNDPCFFVEEVI